MTILDNARSRDSAMRFQGHFSTLSKREAEKQHILLPSRHFFKDFILKESLHPAWHLNSQPWDQESEAPPTEPARRPITFVFFSCEDRIAGDVAESLCDHKTCRPHAEMVHEKDDKTQNPWIQLTNPKMALPRDFFCFSLFSFFSNLHTQHGTQTHYPQIKSCTLCRWSQPGAPYLCNSCVRK